MSLTLNMVGGGGGLSNANAVLIVSIYGTGTAAAATKGAITLAPTMWGQSADTNLETAIFSIPSNQFDQSTPWTVSVEKNGVTKTRTIIIDSAKEYELRIAVSDFYVFKQGDSGLAAGFTPIMRGSGNSFSNGVITLVGGTTQGTRITPKVPYLEWYEKLVVDFIQTRLQGGAQNFIRAGFTSDLTNPDGTVTNKDLIQVYDESSVISSSVQSLNIMTAAAASVYPCYIGIGSNIDGSIRNIYLR